MPFVPHIDFNSGGVSVEYNVEVYVKLCTCNKSDTTIDMRLVWMRGNKMFQGLPVPLEERNS